MIELDNEATGTEAEPPRLSPWNLWDVVLVSAGALAVFILAFAGLQVYFMAAELDLNDENLAIWTSILLGALEGVALLGAVYFLGLRRKNLAWSAVGLKPASGTWWMIAGFLSLLAIPLTGLIALGVQLLLDLPLENPQLEFIAPSGFSWTGLIGMFIMGGLVAPLAEEVFFRGLLYRWLRGRWGIWVGVIVSSLIFGLLHGEISIVVATAFLGAMMALVYEYSGSLWMPLMIHVANNGVKILLLYVMLAIDPSLLNFGL